MLQYFVLETIKGLNVFIYYAVLNYRRSVIRISIELQLLSNPVHRKVRNYHLYIITYECKAFGLMSFFLFYQQDLIVRLTDDTDLYFLYNLVISEEDFQRYSDLIWSFYKIIIHIYCQHSNIWLNMRIFSVIIIICFPSQLKSTTRAFNRLHIIPTEIHRLAWAVHLWTGQRKPTVRDYQNMISYKSFLNVYWL